MPGSEKLKKLHSNLLNQGYDLPDYNTFEVDMQDDKKLNKLHSNLSGQGYDIPDYNTFKSDMGYVSKAPEVKKKDQPNQLTQEPSIDTGSSASGQSGQSSGQGSSYWPTTFGGNQQAATTDPFAASRARAEQQSKAISLVEEKKKTEVAKLPVKKETISLAPDRELLPDKGSINLEDVASPQYLAMQKQVADYKQKQQDEKEAAKVSSTASAILYSKTGSVKKADQYDWFYNAAEEERDDLRSQMMNEGFGDDAIDKFFANAETDAVNRMGLKKSQDFEQNIVKEIAPLKDVLTDAEFNKAYQDRLSNKSLQYGLDQLDANDKESYPVIKEWWEVNNKLKDPKFTGPEREKAIQRAIDLNTKLKDIREGQGDLINPLTGQADKNYTEKVKGEESKFASQSFNSLLNVRQQRMFELMSAEDNYKNSRTQHADIQTSSQNIPYSEYSKLLEASQKEKDRYDNAYYEAKAKFDAINRALLLNENPASVERGLISGYGFVPALGEGLIEGFGSKVSTDEDFKQNFVKALSEKGVNVTKEQVDAAQLNIGQKAGSAIGNSIPAMIQIALTELATQGAGTLKAIPEIAKIFKAIEAASEANKAFKYAAIMTEGALKYGLTPSDDLTAAMGAGEELTQSAFDGMNVSPALAKTKWGKFLALGARTLGGGLVETAAEYGGEYVDALNKNGYDVDSAFKSAVGRDYDEAKDKLMVTFLTSSLFSGTSNVASALIARNYYEAKGDTQRVEEIDNIAKENGIDLEKAKADFDKKVPTPPESTYTKTQEDLIKTTAEQTGKPIEEVEKQLVEEEKIPDLSKENIPTITQQAEPTTATLSDIESTAKALEGTKFNANFNLPLEQIKTPTQVSEAYHKAKLDNSNPELVEAVEQIIGKPKEATSITEPTPTTETPAGKETPQAVSVDAGGEVAKPTFENVPILTRTAEEIETAKNEVFDNLNKLEVGSVIENSDGEIKVVTEKSTDKKGNQLIGIVTYERQEDGSLRQMTNIVWASKSADGKIKLDYNPHSTGTNSKGERVTVTDQITDKKIDLSKENIFTEDENGNLIQINKVEQSIKETPQQSTEELTIEAPKPSAEVIEGDNKAEAKGKVKEKAAKGFISVALNKLTKSLKDFQGRGQEYSQQTYDRIVNEAKGGALNISSIPPIQIWKDKNGNWVILGGHSRTKAFEDLAAGKHELNPKYKKADFANISAQIVEANTLEEAQKIAQESNQGAVQTVVDNAKYVREKLMPTFKSFNDAKTKLRDLYGAAWTRIYAYANLNPKGKAMAYLKAFSENLESESTDISRKMAEWTGKAMSDFNKLTAEHENEIFNYLLENTKIKTYNEFYDILNRRINGIEGFVASEPLNFSAKVGRGSNEIEVIKEIQDAKAEKKRVEDEIRKVQKTEKNKAVRDKTISELTKESIRLNTLIGDLEKKQAQAKEGDALQFNLFNNLNEQIENGNINAEQAEQFLDETNEAEPIIADIERKAESNNEAELNEAIKQADELINKAEQETPQAETPAIEKTNAEKAAEAQRTLADKFRKLKIKKPDAGNLFASTPFDLVWDGALEVIAKSLEASASVTEAAGKALEYIKNSDWYKGLTSEQKAKAEQNLKTHIENEMSSFEAEQKPTEEPKVSEEPKAGKEKAKESKGFKRARLNELDPEIKAKLEGVANYKVQDNKEFNDKIIEFVDEVTPEIAIEYAMDMSENLSDGSAIRKKVILYNAGSKMKMKASEKLKNAKKEGDLAAESEAEAELALAYNAILTASKIGTAAGQLNAIDAELHKKYPSLYMIVAMNEFNKNGNEVLDDNTKFKDESGKDITVAEAIEKERVKIEDEIRKEVEKEFNSRIDELNNEIENLKKDKPVDKKKEIEEKQKKLADRRKEIIAQLKKSGGVAQATFIPFTTKQIELIGELIANLVQSGGLSSKQIINEVVSVVKSFNSAVNKNHIQDIAKSVVEFNEKLTEENATKKNKDKGDEAPKAELTPKKLKEIAMSHLFDRKGVAQTLAKAIIEQTGMDAKQANAIAENISKSIIDPIIDEVVDRRLLNIIKPTETNTNLTDEQIKNKKENRKTANKIKEAIKLGVLSNNEIFQSAFEEKFGFRTLDARTKAKLNNIVEELTKLEADVSKTVSIEGKEVALDTTQRERILDLQKEFNTILQSSTPLNLAIVLSEINSAIYLSILSNPTSTSLKAFIGSFSGAAFGVFSDAFTKGPIATLSGIAATVKPSNIEASLQRAATALKSGLVEVGKTKQSGEFSSERQSAIENALFNGLSEAMKNKEKGKIILKSIGIALKNIRILAAMDAFLVSQTGIYSEAANGSKAKKGGFADRINPKNQEKVFNDIAEKEYSNIKSDIESAVDGDIKSGTVESKNREKEIERRLKARVGSITSPSSAYKTKRVQELTENQRIDNFKKAWSLAQYFSLIGKPDGFLGMGTSWAQRKMSIKPTDNATDASLKFASQMVFKFVNLMGNMYNATMTSIPVLGLANAFFGVGYDPIKGEYVKGILGKYNANKPLLATRVATNLIITGLVIAALEDQLMWDDEEEKYVLNPDRDFDFRGAGFPGIGGYSKNRRTNENYEEFSFSFMKDKNGKFTNYHSFNKYVPQLNAIVATVSAVTDDLKGMDDKLNIKERQDSPFIGYGYKAIGSNIKGFLEGSFNSLGRITKPFLFEESAIDALAQVATNTIVDNAGSLTRPNVVNSVINYVKAANNIPASKRNTLGEKLATAIYMENFFNQDKTDSFGNPIPQTQDFERFITEIPKQSELYPKTAGLMYKFDTGLEISKWRATEVKGYENFNLKGVSYYSTEDVREEATKVQEQEFNRLVTENYAKLNKMDYEKLNKAVKKYQEKSKEYAKKQLVDKYLDVNNKKSIIKKVEK